MKRITDNTKAWIVVGVIALTLIFISIVVS